jgi:N-acetylneuraminic acid mutarotase
MGCPNGALFDPAANSWRPIADAPATLVGRAFGTAVWTGKWVVVWGGLTHDSAGNLLYLGDGARYDPALDVWLPVSTANAPTPRARHSAVWTGTKMIVWGGENVPNYVGDGAAYDPDLDAWAPISSVGAPRARNFAAATWTGQDMIVMSGHDDAGYFRDGGLFDPLTGTWRMLWIPAPDGFISSNEIAWTGNEVLTWSGASGGNWGGLFDPLTKGWREMAPPPMGFAKRVPEVLAWTGTEMIVWGGQTFGEAALTLSDGAVFDPP